MQNSSDYLAKLRDGDIFAFEYLYNYWSAKLYNFVLQISNNDTYHAEDIVQATFVKIWEIKESIDPDKNFGALIYTIARNMFINIHQNNMRKILYEETAKYQHEKERQDSNMIEDELNVRFLEEIINQFISELPPERQKIFILSRKYYLTNKQIAERLNISVNTVESQMSKAIASLRVKLTKYYSLTSMPIINMLISEIINKS